MIRSPYWDNGAIADAGAVTWADGTKGITGTISAANSLVGSSTSDQVGFTGVTALQNGNYVVRSEGWDNESIADAGAVTWGDGTQGVKGVVSNANSLVGTTANDKVGSQSAVALTNGNYVVASPEWDDGSLTDAGAATWCNGTSGCKGAVTTANSLVGAKNGDRAGNDGVKALANGNYVVLSSEWDNGIYDKAGADTWGNGATGLSGVVSSATSLVGSHVEDHVGGAGALALTNGNYVVMSMGWGDGTKVEMGAATWGDGTQGVKGVVSADNSLVGTSIQDWVGIMGFTLTNGNYVLISSKWDNGVRLDAGAITWGDGATGVKGPITASNSLVGRHRQ